MKKQQNQEKTVKTESTFDSLKKRFDYFLYDSTMGQEYVPGPRIIWLGNGLRVGALLASSLLIKKFRYITIPLALLNLVKNIYQIRAMEEISKELIDKQKQKMTEYLNSLDKSGLDQSLIPLAAKKEKLN